MVDVYGQWKLIMTKKLILTLILLLIAGKCYAQDYYVYIRTYDRSGVTKDDDKGRSKKGDIVTIIPCDAQNIPTEIEKKEWLILKVSDLTNEEIQDYTSTWQEQKGIDEKGQPIFETIAYRKNKLDISTLGVGDKPKLIDTKQDKTLFKSKISAKTTIDLVRYEQERTFNQKPIVRFAKISIDKVCRFMLPYAWGSTVVSTINKSGEDYNTLTLWEDAKDGDLVTATTIQEADCYDDDGALTDAFTIDGSTTSADYYMFVTAPVGERHNGTVASGFKITKNAQILNMADDFVKVTFLIFSMTGDPDVVSCVTASDALGYGDIFTNNIIYGTGAFTQRRPVGFSCERRRADAMRFLNNIVYGFTTSSVNKGYGFWQSQSPVGTIYVDNNTIYGCDYGFYFSYPAELKNNISYNNSTADYNGSVNATSSNNLSKDATAPLAVTADSGTCDSDSANHLIDSDQNFLTTVKVGMRVKNTTDTTYGYVTAVNSDSDLTLNTDLCPDGNEAYTIYKAFIGTLTFTNTTAGSEDFHLVSGDTSAIDYGLDLATTPAGVQFDIDNYDRDTEAVTWDIGADEYIAVAGGYAAQVI